MLSAWRPFQSQVGRVKVSLTPFLPGMLAFTFKEDGRRHRRDGARSPPEPQGPPTHPERMCPLPCSPGVQLEECQDVRLGTEIWTAALPGPSPVGEKPHRQSHVWDTGVPTRGAHPPPDPQPPGQARGLGLAEQGHVHHLMGWPLKLSPGKNLFSEARRLLQTRQRSVTTFCPKQLGSEKLTKQVWPMCSYSVVPFFFQTKNSYFFSK